MNSSLHLLAIGLISAGLTSFCGCQQNDPQTAREAAWEAQENLEETREDAAEIVAESEEDAVDMVAEAREDANREIRDAKQNAEDMVADAERNLQQKLDQLSEKPLTEPEPQPTSQEFQQPVVEGASEPEPDAPAPE